ncbi:hypothetical protein NDU88_001412 [Pleurodeles waltl]|uniref:Uncharacterized protein n=1 Tax=Pleurodeles waltl TaxID=8319 RepID=A0AAV7TIH9_PLEWA|nr:hypothetical protein NDU88_001412 [Pleurodeles waltl]
MFFWTTGELSLVTAGGAVTVVCPAGGAGTRDLARRGGSRLPRFSRQVVLCWFACHRLRPVPFCSCLPDASVPRGLWFAPKDPLGPREQGVGRRVESFFNQLVGLLMQFVHCAYQLSGQWGW